MGEMKHNDRLPHNHLDKAKREKIITEVYNDLKNLSDAVAYLKSHNIPSTTTEEIKNITTDSVKAYIMGECAKFLQSASFIPNELVNTTKMQFFNAYKEIEPSVIQVQSIISKYNTIPLVFAEDGTLSYVIEEVEKYATEKATTHLTKDFRDKYDCYKELYRAFLKCNQTEKEHGWRELSTQGFMAHFGIDQNQPFPLSIWQIMTGAYLGAEPKELTPERFMNSMSKFL